MGKYPARGHGVRPDLTQSISILSYDHRAFPFFFWVTKFGMFTYVAHFDRKVVSVHILCAFIAKLLLKKSPYEGRMRS